ncbi:MAG: hypothetical protein ACKVON_06660 [Beijerinckiaceae bacterium]
MSGGKGLRHLSGLSINTQRTNLSSEDFSRSGLQPGAIIAKTMARHDGQRVRVLAA